jgi:hypothetical protein
VQGIELHCTPELLAAKPPPDPIRQWANRPILRDPCRVGVREPQKAARESEDGSGPGADDCQLEKDRHIHSIYSFQPRSTSFPQPSIDPHINVSRL